MNKRLTLGVVAGLTVFGAVFAMAASLGGITSTGLGADNTTIASCDTDGVSTTYTVTYDGTDGRYEVSGVTITGIAEACDGKSLKVTLADSAGASLGEATGTVPTDALATTASVTFLAPASAESAANVHVVISG